MILKFNNLIFCIVFFSCLVSSAQKLSMELKGKVESNTTDVSDVHVINTRKNQATITNQYGYFRIKASVNDTLWFSAIQFDKSFLVVDDKIIESELVTVALEESLTELDEVVVTPYNLSGNLHMDIQSMKFKPTVSSTSLRLPNAEVKPLSLNERKLFLAMQEQLLHRLIDEITGHNKKLRNSVSVDKLEKEIQTIRNSYPDSLYKERLKIPSEKIDDFIYYCAVDTIFNSTVQSRDKLKIWSFLERKSLAYRKNNYLD
ncbi:hypothetical protein SAMN04487891_10365 [Flagellimonas taeanensis]|jgi:hypothetical protein|uniref:CarboxypepD_reg-like domain-containing protein n=2 Tax=Flavobacteriales TaxID=200644 RepID=A0A1M6T5S5_9FLAO|nr:hypothetical protein [Allomuricauda sp.]SFB85567.1 hypothetical protein SAMN04487891_10365 [Allomuricauda taeanensis]MAO18932.1 hypothetical protein [Allomuricauda sp.]MAU17825.1 hypothetical protein [Allomuricauda sp.]MBO6845776.1 hypothetical protein [Allomuricauda sp.]SHK52088.1 hypothetical protein SAMN05216293_1226 [Allomuricauda taeanensis]|tara:strand:+ start:359 stop:1135 length:777 start_codon:yes stop_codon:yes gene_type:complete